MLWKKDAA